MEGWTVDFDQLYRDLEQLYAWLQSGQTMVDQQLLAVAAALLAGLTMMTIAGRVRLSFSRSPRRALAAYVAYTEAQAPAQHNFWTDKDAVILLALGLPHDRRLLPMIRLAAGALPALLLLLFGFPVAPAVAGGGLIYILTNAFLNSQWRKLRVKLEQELPTFVSRLAGTLLVTNAPLKAIAEVADTLSEESPLNGWLQRLLSGTRLEGRRFIEQARAEAAVISPSLALVIFELGRLLETGGAGFTRAFATTAEELSAILEARAVAGAKAESARGAVFMMLGIMGVIMVLMISSPNIRQGFQNPAVQVVTALALAVMAFGYGFLNSLIGALGFVYPFVRLRRRANQIRRMVLRALPELAALMAAEMAAGNPPDKALERAATWGGVLSALIGEVLEASRTNNRPVFGRGERPGMLVEVVTRYDLPALRAFATQIDLAARKGAAGPELMESLARTLIIEYKERALREAEALDNRLAVPAVVFFFLPFLFLLLAPLIVPLLRIL